MLLVVGAVVVVVIAVAAVVSQLGSGGAKKTPSGVEQTRPVTATGAAVPGFDSARATDPAVGTAIPTISGESFDGTTVQIRPGQGPLLVMGIAHWCPHCQSDVPRITSWLRSNQLPAGVQVIAVSTSVSADRPNYPPSSWLSREGFPVTTLADDSDNTAGKALGITSLPYYVAIDARGHVVKRLAGEVDEATMAALMQRALGTPRT